MKQTKLIVTLVFCCLMAGVKAQIPENSQDIPAQQSFEADTIKVEILSIPSGADIRVAGKSIGITPCDILLPPGRHLISLSRFAESDRLYQYNELYLAKDTTLFFALKANSNEKLKIDVPVHFSTNQNHFHGFDKYDNGLLNRSYIKHFDGTVVDNTTFASDTTKSYISFFNGTVVSGDNLMLKRNKIFVDSNVYLANAVKFINFDGVFYANSRKEGRNPRFIKREFSGKINYYKEEQKKISYSRMRTPGFYSGNTYIPGWDMPGYYTTKNVLKQYYNFGYGDVKKATYKNLLEDIGQNPNSKYYLDIMEKKARPVGIIGLTGLGLVIIGGFFINSPSWIGGGALLGGVTLITTSIIISSSVYEESLQLIEQAIKAYN